jgi:hypothetical protein
MTRVSAIVTTAILACGATVFESLAVAADEKAASAKAKVKAAVSDTDVTYGRIKELNAGQKIVINIDNAPDKTFDLADKDLRVTLAKGLKVGDPVKVNEHEVAGKTRSVTITKHVGGGVAHGDKDPAAKKP